MNEVIIKQWFFIITIIEKQIYLLSIIFNYIPEGKNILREFNFADGRKDIFRGNLISRMAERIYFGGI